MTTTPQAHITTAMVLPLGRLRVAGNALAAASVIFADR